MPNERDALIARLPPLFVGYDKAFALVRHLEADVLAYRPELIVGVLRSGLIPALMLSQRITVPVAFCACNRGDSVARLPDAREVAGKRVLVVDDFATTGATLAKVCDLLRGLGAACRTLAVFYDADLVPPPDYGHRAEHFIQFVWDKLEVTPSSRALFASRGGRYAPDAVHECFGVDVDGLLLNQATELCAKVRAHVLQKRPDSVVLVTAKAAPEVQAALGALGLGHLPLVGAEGGALTGADAAVRHKTGQIRACGISTFYEGSTEQALGIAQASPVTDVVLWSAGAGAPLRIHVEHATQ